MWCQVLKAVFLKASTFRLFRRGEGSCQTWLDILVCLCALAWISARAIIIFDSTANKNVCGAPPDGLPEIIPHVMAKLLPEAVGLALFLEVPFHFCVARCSPTRRSQVVQQSKWTFRFTPHSLTVQG